jgi:cbb3-type cytochrome oxidase subunit 3
MTGRIRRFYFTVGLIVFLLVALALLMASYRAASQDRLQNEANGQALKRSSVGTFERFNVKSSNALSFFQSGTTQL